MMNSGYISERITELRLKKGVSEYKMSLDLGHSKGYVQSITSGRALPSMSEFLYICDYFQISPAEFFCSGERATFLQNELLSKASSLSADDLKLLLLIADRLIGRKEGKP